MSQAQDTSKLTPYLDALESALDEGNPKDVLAFLRVLRMNGLDGETSAELVAAFTEAPEPSDFERARQWAASRAEQIATESQQPPESDSELDSDFDDLLGDFDDFDDFDPFESGDFISIADDISEMDEIDDADAFLDLEDSDADLDIDIEMDLDIDMDFEDEPTSTSDQAHSPEESFPPSEEFHTEEYFDAEHTPEPAPTIRQMAADPSSRLDNDFESEPGLTPVSAPSNITGEREKTRQFDPAHLQQALSSASNVESESDGASDEDASDDPFNPFSGPEEPTSLTEQPESLAPDLGSLDEPTNREQADIDVDFALGSSISTPLEDYGLRSGTDSADKDVHDRPTKKEFPAPDTGAPLAEIPDSSEGPGTAEIANPAQFDSGFGDSQEPAAESDDNFAFDLGPETGNTAGDDDFDFDLSPDASDDFSDSDDGFDFDLSPDASDDFSDSDDGFDFDLSPDISDDSSDDDFDFDFAPETDDTPESSPGAKMAYAAPPEAEESFFPPPIVETEQTSASDRTPTPSPFPESPSVAAEPASMPEPPEPGSSETPHSISQERPRQDTPMVQAADVDAFQQSQPTPARGMTPLPESDGSKTPFPPAASSGTGGSLHDQTPFPTASSSGASSSLAEPTPMPTSSTSEAPLAEEELLALGEELSAPMKSEPEFSHQDEEDSGAKNRYRGEPMIREMGDEPTPGVEDPSEFSDNPFSGAGSSEGTNPFAQETPTGVRDEPMQAAHQSSFVLEEVASEPNIADPEQAIAATLDQARAHYEQAEFKDALELVDAVLEVDEESKPAKELQNILERELERVQSTRLGSLMRTPTLSVSMGDIAGLDLDNRAGFLISQIDGMLTFEDILDMSAMSRLETLTVLVQLYEEDIISVD